MGWRRYPKDQNLGAVGLRVEQAALEQAHEQKKTWEACSGSGRFPSLFLLLNLLKHSLPDPEPHRPQNLVLGVSMPSHIRSRL